MFEDDRILVDENTVMLEGKLERWLGVLEKNRLTTNTVKTEFSEFRFQNNVNRNGSDHNISFVGQLLTKWKS